MVRNELYKVLIKQKFWLIIMFAIFAKLALLFSEVAFINTDIEPIKHGYQEYISPFLGELTNESERKITEDYRLVVSGRLEAQENRSAYENGEISAEEFRQKSSESAMLFTNEEVVIHAYKTLEHIKEQPKNRHLIYSNGWEAFLGNERLDIASILILIVLASYFYSFDHESGAFPVICATSRGKSRLAQARQLALLWLTIGLSLLFFIAEYLYFALKYGLPSANSPVQSLLSFANSPYQINLLQTAIIIFAIKTIALIFIIQITTIIARWLKKTFVTTLAVALAVLLPFALFNGKTARYFITPLGLLLGNGYLKGNNSEGVLQDGVIQVVAFEGVDFKLTLAIILATIIFSGILYAINIAISSKLKDSYQVRAYFKSSVITGIVAVGFIAVFGVISATAKHDFNATFSIGMGQIDGDKAYINYNNMKSELMEVDIKTENEISLIRNLTKEKSVSFYDLDREFIYYFQKDDISGDYHYMRINKNNYHEESIFTERRGSRRFVRSTKFLGLIEEVNIDNTSYSEEQKSDIDAFWVDGNFLFTVDKKKLEHGRFHKG